MRMLKLRVREKRSKNATPSSNLLLAPLLYFTFMVRDEEFCRILQHTISDFLTICNSVFVVVPICATLGGFIHNKFEQ